MSRILPILLIFAVACTSGPEAVQIPPLPVGDERIVFLDAVKRIRAHSETATEAFYRDEWDCVAASARRIEQTAKFLPTSTDIPANLGGKVLGETTQLTEEAKRLEAAALRSDAMGVGESLSRIRFRIRTLQGGK